MATHAMSNERAQPALRRFMSDRLSAVLILGGFGVWLFGAFLATTSVGFGWRLLFYILGGILMGVGFDLMTGSLNTWWIGVSIGILLPLTAMGMEDGTGERARVLLIGCAFMLLLAVVIRLVQALTNLERERSGQVIAEERRRIAGEVHDVVGHTMSVTMLHLTSARLALRTDPDAAVAALDEAERQGRQSMNDIRSVVRLLRADDAPPHLAPAQSADIATLVDQYRKGGADITLDVEPAAGELPATASLTAYRVVQEGLNNAVRHGSGPIAVTMCDTGDAVEIVITNPVRHLSANRHDGSGLNGMRDRLTALEGTLDVGPVPDRSAWRLHARIPR
jgi:signal transduction histidine kinase